MAFKPGQRNRVTARSFTGVRTTSSPYDDPLTLLTDAQNLYWPTSGSSASLRPGFGLLNSGNAVYQPTTPFRGQCVYAHQMLDGSSINFVVIGGHIFRQDVGVFTDVTPAGIAVDSALTTQVYMLSLLGALMVTDGVNRPWIGSDLTSTPITGTYIDYDGAGGAWTTYGKPTLWQNTAFVILGSVNGVSRRTDIAWCQPGILSLGWQQSDFDNNWTLVTSSDAPLYAIRGTETGFYYFRPLSIGKAVGTVGPDLASSATEDTISFNVGTFAAQTLQEFGSAFLLCDAIGRPQRISYQSAPTPIWEQMQSIVDDNQTGAPSITAQVACSVIDPTLNKYIVGIWSPTPGTQASVTELYSFRALDGTYEGRLSVRGGCSIDTLGTFQDSSGRVTTVAIGSKVVGGPSGYVWFLNVTSSEPLTRTTMTGATRTTMTGATRTTMSQAETFVDDGTTIDAYGIGPRMNYSDDYGANVDIGTIITTSDAPVAISCITSAEALTLIGTPTPAASNDGTYRLLCDFDNFFGRGPRIKVSPTVTTKPWSIQSIGATMVMSMLEPDEA